MKWLLATKNEGKLREFRRMLEPLGHQVLSMADLSVDIDVEETGTTFEENAALKAVALYNATGVPTIADDSGLEVDALNGAPGVYSARYGGLSTDQERNTYLLEQLKTVPKEKRTARFVAVLHIIFDDTRQESIRGCCEGFIGTTPLGAKGFGYDPVFMVGEGESFATIDPAKKDALSHRGAALQQFCRLLKESERDVNK